MKRDRDSGKQTLLLPLLAAVMLAPSAMAADAKDSPGASWQNPAGNPRMREAMQCSAQDASGDGLGLSRARNVKRDASCLAEWSKVAETVRGGSGIVIDTRPVEAYSRAHVPGSLQIASDLIKSKSIFAAKPVVVVGDGKAGAQQEELCAELKGAGFRNVKIVSGGMLAWARTEEAQSSGETIDIRGLAELSASELYAELQASDNVVIGFSPQFSNRQVDARRIRIEAPLTPERLAAVAQKAMKQAKVPVRRIVLVGVNTVDPRTLLDVLSTRRVEVPVFYYAGDLQSYELAVARLDSQWAKQRKGPAAQKCGFS